MGLIRKIVQHIQQHLTNRMWGNTVKKMYLDKARIAMVIIGKVTGRLEFRDINRTVSYNATISLTEIEVNKSKDLQNAIRHGWVEIIEDRGMIQRALVSSQRANVVVQQQDMNTEQIMNMAREMAKTMASEMMKNNTDVQSLAKEMAKEMVKEINGKILIQTNEKQIEKEEKEQSSNVFIDIGDTGARANTENIGTVREEKSDLSSSLEKVRRFRKVQNG